MANVSRRGFLGFLSTTPIISGWMVALGYAPAKQKPPDEQYLNRRRAFDMLRLVNTLQNWNGTFVPKEELSASRGYQKLKDRDHIRQDFRKVLESFSPADSFEIPGYEVVIQPTRDKSKYVAMISMKTPAYTARFVTNQEGVIYEISDRPEVPQGASLSIHDYINLQIDRAAREATSKEAAALPTGLFATIFSTRFATMLFSFRVPGGNQNCACCNTDFPSPCSNSCSCQGNCPSDTTCIDSAESYCCVNCGCVSCTWCRKVTCIPSPGDCTACDGCSGVCESEGDDSCVCAL